MLCMLQNIRTVLLQEIVDGLGAKVGYRPTTLAWSETKSVKSTFLIGSGWITP